MLCLVAQLCQTLFNPMDCSLPGSSVHGDSPGKNTEVSCHALLQGIFPTQALNPGLLYCRQILYHLSHLRLKLMMGFPNGSDDKEYTCNTGDLGSIPGSGRSPGGGHGNQLHYSCQENPHGQRSLVGYSSWGHKESDMTERLSTAHTHTHTLQSSFY